MPWTPPTQVCYLNVSLPVDITKHFLQEPETALEDGEHYLGPASLLPLLQLSLNVAQYKSDELNDGYYERTKCQRPSVKSGE